MLANAAHQCERPAWALRCQRQHRVGCSQVGPVVAGNKQCQRLCAPAQLLLQRSAPGRLQPGILWQPGAIGRQFNVLWRAAVQLRQARAVGAADRPHPLGAAHQLRLGCGHLGHRTLRHIARAQVQRTGQRRWHGVLLWRGHVQHHRLHVGFHVVRVVPHWTAPKRKHQRRQVHMR